MTNKLHDLTRRQVIIAGIAGSGTSVIDQLSSGSKESPNGENKVEKPEIPDREEGPVEYIVGTTGEETMKKVHDASESVNTVLEFGLQGDAVAGKFASDALEQIGQMSGVRYIERDETLCEHQQTMSWGVERIGTRHAHERGVTGESVDVSVIDSGIEPDHPDLQENIGEGTAFVSCTGSCSEPWDDDRGHGTTVAGIIGAVNNDIGVLGVSPETTLHAVKVINDEGVSKTSDTAEGVIWTADQGYDIANLSLGGSSYTQTLADACAYAYQQGVLLVASAGNSYGGNVRYPAAYPTVIAVNSTTSEDELSSFSSTGPEVELAAPGSRIYSTAVDGSYRTATGTSMAAPHVSGAGALLMARGLSNTEARDRLNETAEDIELDENEQGNGLVDVAAAVDQSVITITGAGSETAHYTFTLEGDVEKSTEYGGTINSYNEIHGSFVTGRTTNEPDSFRFDGEITGLSASAPVDVQIDGEEVDPDGFGETVITLTGQGSTSYYTFSVEGDVEKSTEYGGTINSYDEITPHEEFTSIATGRTTNEPDSFAFAGEVTSLSTSTSTEVLINGKEIVTDGFRETIITITGQGNTTYYEFDYIGAIEKSTAYGGTINEFDEIHDSKVTGRTTNDPDSFRFEGEIPEFDADNPINVEFNGQATGSWM